MGGCGQRKGQDDGSRSNVWGLGKSDVHGGHPALWRGVLRRLGVHDNRIGAPMIGKTRQHHAERQP